METTSLQRLRLDGKVAVITGGARGVGRGVAKVLSEAGASVVLTARTQADLDVTVAQINGQGARAVAVAADASQRIENARTVETALEAFGRIDIVVNNAGGAGRASFEEITEEKFLHDFQFNVVSAFSLTQLAAPHMRKSGGGAIVNISSRASQLGGPGFLTYSVVKAGLEQMTRMLARDLAPDIRVNAISLGMISTDALAGYLDAQPGARERVLRQIPLQRIGDVGDVGLAALFLCAENGYATGAVLNIDGGIDKSPSLTG